MPLKDPKKRKRYHAQYMKEVWYPKNRKKHISYVAKLKTKVAAFIMQRKLEGKCLDCGFEGRRAPFVLDFDHRNGLADKKFAIGDWARSVLSIEKIKAEMSKCDLVCANCHRIRTYKRFKNAR
ncbi:MAG: hypothetical protein NBV63_00105 [Candidatus Pacebacteria bacterium]|nr:hypothetical protein [Candidatus Paceibacterota bacterium]